PPHRRHTARWFFQHVRSAESSGNRLMTLQPVLAAGMIRDTAPRTVPTSGDAVEADGMAHPRTLLMGCGGVGGILAAKLFEQGFDPCGATNNPAITAAVNARGLVVRFDGRQEVTPGVASTALPDDAGLFDVILLATQPPQVEEAARVALPHLADAGAMVCL